MIHQLYLNYKKREKRERRLTHEIIKADSTWLVLKCGVQTINTMQIKRKRLRTDRPRSCMSPIYQDTCNYLKYEDTGFGLDDF